MPPLAHFITTHILDQPNSCITFADYMEWALYHPVMGYYATRALDMGKKGDFVTASHLSEDFGQLLALQFVQMWNVLGKPQKFTLLEMGAGQGKVAYDILKFLGQHHDDLYSILDYAIIERSAQFVNLQQQVLRDFSVRWCSWDDFPPDSIVGCCFSNELVDAFPVHRLTIQNGELAELYVTVNRDGWSKLDQPHPVPSSLIHQFKDQIGPLSTPELGSYFSFVGINLPSLMYEDGYVTEVNLAALDWLEKIAVRMNYGYLLTIDYGHLSPQYYHPARCQGTLQCYYHHGHHPDPYRWVGQQDITCHVDFTALQRQGERWGLKTQGFTQQALFLMSLGLGDRLVALTTPNGDGNQSDLSDLNMILQRRDALQALINPMGLGNFKVLIQSKGVADDSLTWFSTDPVTPVRG